VSFVSAIAQIVTGTTFIFMGDPYTEAREPPMTLRCPLPAAKRSMRIPRLSPPRERCREEGRYARSQNGCGRP
jgi:hypothetical protein